jgi:hypothetical protein
MRLKRVDGKIGIYNEDVLVTETDIAIVAVDGSETVTATGKVTALCSVDASCFPMAVE